MEEERTEFEELREVSLMTQDDETVLEQEVENQLVEEKDNSQEIENNVTTETSIQDELELSKHKVEDNFSEVSNRSIQDIIRCKVKTHVILQCLTSQLQVELDKRTNLEKLLSVLEQQHTCLEKQLYLQKVDRAEIKKEIQTVDTILSTLKNELEGYENCFNEHKLQMVQYSDKMHKVFSEYESFKEKFPEEIRLNEVRIQEKRAELQAIKNKSTENHKKFLNEKLYLEENLKKLREKFEAEKKRGEELLNQRSIYVQQIMENNNSLTKIENEISLIPLEESEIMLKKQEKEDRDKINLMNNEIELFNQRLMIQSDNLTELNMKLELAKTNHLTLLECNKNIKRQTNENRIQYEELSNKLENNRLKYKNELNTLLETKQEIEERIKKVDLDIISKSKSGNELTAKLDISKERLNECFSTFTSSSNVKKEIENEVEHYSIILKTSISRKEELSNTLIDIQNKVAQLNEKKLLAEKDFELLKITGLNAHEQLKKELETIKERENKVTTSVMEFENIKSKDREKFLHFKENNETILKKLENNLQCLKSDLNSKGTIVKDLSERLRLKTENRDDLHKQFKKLQHNIECLEKDVETKKRKNVVSESTSFQKPISILKSANIKSPQKKVTFDENINWDTLSDSSVDVDAFFDRILNPTNSTGETKKSSSDGDNIFDTLYRNSPPERETSTSASNLFE